MYKAEDLEKMIEKLISWLPLHNKLIYSNQIYTAANVYAASLVVKL